MFMFKLIIVRPKITSVPTPAGPFPVLELRKDLVTAYRKKVEWQTDQKLLRYKMMCIRKKVDAEIVQIESDDVMNALSREVDKSSVNKLVIGASSHGMTSSRCRNVSSEIAESIPKFCTVYVVSKGKVLSSLRPTVSETHETNKKDGSEISSSTDDSPIQNTSSHSEWTESNAVSSPAHLDFPSLPMQQFSYVHQALLHKEKISNENSDSKFVSPNIDGVDVVNYCPGNSAIDHPYGVVDSNHNSRISHQDSRSDGLPEFSLENQTNIDFELEKLRIELRRIRGMYPMARTVDIDASRKMNVDLELEKLRIELRHIQGMYAMAQRAAIDASRKVNDLHKRLMEDSIKLGEINAKKAEAKELAIQERLKYETAKREAEYMKECAEREAAEKKEEENKALHEAKEKEKLENMLVGPIQQYQKFKREEIKSATSPLSDNLEIGLGTYGTIMYNSSWHRTTAAETIDSKFISPDIDGDDDRDLLSWKLGYWLSNIEKLA